MPDFDEDQIIVSSPEDMIQVITKKEYIINIDTPIEDACNYRQALHILRTATENDTIKVVLNTPGGFLTTAIAIANGLLHTKAKTTAEIVEACSAGMVVALSCDELSIVNHGYVMLHTLSGGAIGKQSDMKAQGDFLDAFAENLAKTVYQGFLTNAEIKNLLCGTEIWLDKKAVESRLRSWVPMRKRKIK